MAKTKTPEKSISQLLTNPPADPSRVQAIPLTQIHPSGSNPRKSFDEEAISDLAKSMDDVGLIQPITVRPDADGYEIVTGERRYRAAQQLGWETISAMVRNIGDEEILEIQIIENLQRADVSPMDEAVAFKSILQRENFEWLCTRIHKSKKYVTDRLKLNDLIEDAHMHVHSGALPLSHAIMISKLPVAEQQKCLEKCVDESFMVEKPTCILTFHDLQEFIQDNLMVDLEKACFDLDDAELLPLEGSCTTCQKRTCNQNLLFQEITEDDKCSDPACFHAKEKAHLDKNLKDTKEKHGKGNVLTGKIPPYEIGKVIEVKGVTVNYTETEPKGKKHTAVVINKTGNFSKDRLGKIVYVKTEDIEKKTQEKADRKAGNGSTRGMSYEDRRKKEFVEEIYPRLQKIVMFIEKGNATESSDVAENYLRCRLDRENDRNVVALAAMLGLYNIGGSAEIVWNADEGVETWSEKIVIIDRIIERLQVLGINGILTVFAMLNALGNDDEEPQTDKDMELNEDCSFNWPDIMLRLEPPATVFVKGRKKKNQS